MSSEFTKSWESALKSAKSKYTLMESVASAVSNKDRVKLCCSHDKIGNMLLYSVWSIVHKNRVFCKHDMTSREYLVRGKFFQSRKLATALNYCTKALFYATLGSHEELSAFARRSSVLFDMGKFQECISDVDNALKYEKSDWGFEYTADLLKRKAEACSRLGRLEEAQACLDKLRMVPSDDTFNHLEKAVESLKITKEEVIAQTDSDTEFEKEFTRLKDNLKTRPDFPFASEAITIATSPGKGRHVIARDDIKSGDVLFVEKPFTFVCLPDSLFRHCHQCCRRIFNPYPCEHCSGASYCSLDCRREAWSLYHQWECGAGLDLCYNVGIGHLALRVALVGSALKNAEYQRVMELEDHIDKLDAENLLYFTMMAALFVKYLSFHTKFFPLDSTDDDRYAFGGIILKHIAQLVVNGHALSYCHLSDSDVVQDEEEVRVATGIFPSASMMNHSCDPTITNSFFNQFLIVKAIKDVPAGSEISNCYGPHFRRMPKKERQESLESQYQFKCNCSACSEPVDFIEKFTDGLMCPACSASVVLHADACSKCSKSISSDSWSMIEGADQLYLSAKEALAEKLFVEARVLAEQSMHARSLFLYKNHKSLLQSKDLLAMIYANLGDYWECFKLLDEALEGIKEIYGDNSIEFASEILKLSDAVIQLSQTSKALLSRNRDVLERTISYLKQSKSILNFHYCQFNPKYSELLKALDHLSRVRNDLRETAQDEN